MRHARHADNGEAIWCCIEPSDVLYYYLEMSWLQLYVDRVDICWVYMQCCHAPKTAECNTTQIINKLNVYWFQRTWYFLNDKIQTRTDFVFLSATNNVEEEIDVASIYTCETLQHYDFSWKHIENKNHEVGTSKYSHQDNFVSTELSSTGWHNMLWQLVCRNRFAYHNCQFSLPNN